MVYKNKKFCKFLYLKIEHLKFLLYKLIQVSLSANKDSEFWIGLAIKNIFPQSKLYFSNYLI